MEEQKPHFVCKGACGGVAGEPGNCQTEGCPNHGKPLEACHCADGQHQTADKE